MLARASRQFCTAVEANAALRGAAAKSWERLIDAEWVDCEEKIPEISEAEAVIDKYRSVYNGSEDSLYKTMSDLYVAKEAAKICELYSDHIDHLMREHMDMTGFLGNETQIPPGQEKMAVQTLQEYVAFVNSVENDRIQRKVEAQLGRKIIVLRMCLSIENFSLHFTPMACDRMVTDVNVSNAMAPKNDQPAHVAEGQK